MRLGRQITGYSSQLIAAFAVTAVLTMASLAASSSAAQAQGLPPSIPAFFYGAVVVDGQPPAAGTQVTARIGEKDCTQVGNNGTFPEGNLSAYSITVAHTSQIEGCGTEGATITFFIGGQQATQTANWQAGPRELGLSVGSQAPPPLPTATPGGPSAATPTDPTAAAATATTRAMFTPLPAPSALPTDDQIFPTSTPGTGTAAAGTATPGSSGTPGSASTTTGTPGTGGTASSDDSSDDDGGNGPLIVIAAVAGVLLVAGTVGGVMAARRRSGPGEPPAI